MTKCVVCGKEFESKRSTAKYCSAACRMKAGRVSVTEDVGVSVTEPLSVTPVSVTSGLSVTDNVTDNVSVTPNDDPWSPDFDLSEVGFIRRNKNWNDDGLYPGTAASRKDCIQVSRQIHADRQREIAEAVKERAVIAAAVETGNDAHRIGRQRGEA